MKYILWTLHSEGSCSYENINNRKKIELTDGIKGAVEDKLSKLDRYLHEDTEVKVTVSARKAKQK